MAIVKTKFRVSRLEGELSAESGDSMSSNEDELQQTSSGSEYDDDKDDSDDDSGAGSDDFDLLELGEIGEELCQVGNQYCSIPFELYDLPDLTEILSVDTWNNCLTEEERFSLAEYLPAMDQEPFMRTLKELFSGRNLHFGSPMIKLFNLLKGGLCEPRVALYKQSSNLFQKRRHYHLLQKYQNSMVSGLIQVRDAWENFKGYGIGERIRVLNIMRNQRNMVFEKMDDLGLETDSSGDEVSEEALWAKRLMEIKFGPKMGDRAVSKVAPTMDVSQGRSMPLELPKYGKQKQKGILKLTGPKVHSVKELMGQFSSSQMTIQRDQNAANGNASAKVGLLKPGKKQDLLKSDRFASDSFMDMPWALKNGALHSHDWNRNVNQMTGTEKLSTKQVNGRNSFDYNYRDAGKNVKYLEKLHQPTVEDRFNVADDRAQHLQLKGIPVDFLDDNQPFRHNKTQKGDFSIDHQIKFNDWDAKMKKWKMGNEFQTGKKNVVSDLKVNSHGVFPPQVNGKLFTPDSRARASQKKIQRKSFQNGERNSEERRGIGMFTHSDETESESSEQGDEEEEEEYILPLRRKLGYSGGASKDRRSVSVKPPPEPKKVNTLARKDKKYHCEDLGVISSSKGKKKGHIKHETAENLHRPLERKQKGKVDHEYSGSQSHYMHDYSDGEDVDLHVTSRLLDHHSVTDRLWKKGHSAEARVSNHDEGSNMSLSGCSSVTKKRKGKADVPCMDALDESEPLVIESGLADIESETKPAKPFTLITPTVHTGFSFSIIHLLSAVRVALVSPLAEDYSEVGRHIEKNNEIQNSRKEEQNGNHEDLKGVSSSHSFENNNACISADAGHKNLPSLTVQEIVNRVKSNPGDPCILETQEPLQDLVRGVLKIFSSKTAPLGAKGWKTLVVYEKSTKSWSWIGPVPSSSSDPDTVEEVTSPEAWGLPHKMLVKLVDSFANWLKSGQETLQQIGSLPEPPLMSMQPNLDEKERFRDLRAQKSLTTINPSSEEMRAYFRKEEFLRYSIPDRAFSYTAADGRKSMVAPLRRCGGKPTSKARDHYMLKPDRPPHVTVLCLVRDAAARLPGSIGTRADVCTLIRDSQYIVENVADAQVNQVVSGALDRLHYELDPCVKFDIDRKLWVYLHRTREEEDFEDDGTSSTKKWKRQRKDIPGPTDLGAVTVTYHERGERTGGDSADEYEIGSDLNAALSSMHAGDRAEPSHNDLRSNGEQNNEPFVQSARSSVHDQGHRIGWEVPDLNSLQESRLICHETFDEGTFNRDRHVQTLSASIQ